MLLLLLGENRMREIKFRAWDNTNKDIGGQVMYDWDRLNALDADGVLSLVDLLVNGWDKQGIPMQYTGLRDKNGKEIYEGDILKHEYPEVSLLKVVYNRGGFNIVGIHLKEPMSELLNPDNSLYIQSEIVGNIYENPELVKV
jgi:uncharacterized phage protein (TIGR01671 family)